jgi:hypothetical protein
MWSSLFRTWFFSSDEYVFAAEVIRFTRGDFHQHFFDMPGTPFMALTALAWHLFYAAHRITGQLGAQAGMGPFTFDHLPALFILMRSMTLFLYGLSIALTFWVAAKLMNAAAAYPAALILAMSPIYTSYSSFVRVESMAMCLVLAAILCIAYAPDRRRPRVLVFGAGFLAGVACATRLHSVTASLPVLTLMLIFGRGRDGSDAYPGWVKRVGLVTAVGIAIGVSLLIPSRGHFASWPHAFRLLQVALAVAACSTLLAFALGSSRRTRPFLIRVLSPEVIIVFLGVGCGLLAGVPTVISQHDFLFQSMELYSVNYVDVGRAALPFWVNVRGYVVSYFSVLTPDVVVLVLFLAGGIWITVRRDRALIPILIGCALFFVSKPLNLLAQPHHVILWLPFYALVASYPTGALTRALSPIRIWAPVIPAFTVATIWWLSTPGPKLVEGASAAVEQRLGNVLRASMWIEQHTSPDAIVAISYFCFNPDVFYTWLRSLEVPVPATVAGGRTYLIWWGHASALKGKTGYACVTEGDRPSIKRRLDEVFPGEGTDPFTDPRFARVESFGTKPHEVFLFRFDYR